MEAEVLRTVASTEAVATSEAFRVGPFDDPDRYQIGQPVEAGAEGILYRGQLVTPTSRLSLPVAVKALQPAYSARIDQWAARWRDQVELLRSLQIPGLVGVREGFVGPMPHRQGAETAGRNLYLVMNWVEGEALDHWVLHHRGVDVGNALKLLLPVAVAVDTMHGGQLTGLVPVVHRDIKPANILIGKGGSVLVDFGLTKGLSSGHPVGRAGTPGYIAPEVVAGGGYTPAADRYAFGATVFFLLTGRHPSTATRSAELRHMLEASTCRDGLRPGGAGGSGAAEGGIPPELVERVLLMLDPDPDRRPDALANWIAQLRQSSLDDEALTVRLAPPAPARPRRARGGGVTTAGSRSLRAAVDPTRTAGAAGMAGTARAAHGPDGAPRAAWTAERSGLADNALEAGTGVTESPEPVTGAQARGGAHRAPRRGRRHARHRRVLTSRYALVGMLAVALALVASDAGAVAPPTRHHGVSSAFAASRSATGGSSNAVLGYSGRDIGGPGSVSGTPAAAGAGPGGSADAGKATAAPTTTALTGSPSCVLSFAPACGALVWSPAAINKPLTLRFSWYPQHPVAGQQVTFTIVLDDPDDAHNLQIDSSYFGDPAGGVSSTGAPAASGPGPGSCQMPRGTWPPPPPGPPGHRELQLTHIYASPGSYQVRFAASSGQDVSPCYLPDPYASSAESPVQTVAVDAAPPPQTTTTSTTTTLPPPTTTTSVMSGPPV